MKEQQEIIQKICEKLGHKNIVMFCFCKYTHQLKIDMIPLNRMELLTVLGWLKSKEVLIGVYGTENYYAVMGTSGGYEADDFYIEWKKESELEKLDNPPDEYGMLEAWQYHHNQMGCTVEECLEYYGRELK